MHQPTCCRSLSLEQRLRRLPPLSRAPAAACTCWLQPAALQRNIMAADRSAALASTLVTPLMNVHQGALATVPFPRRRPAPAHALSPLIHTYLPRPPQLSFDVSLPAVYPPCPFSLRRSCTPPVCSLAQQSTPPTQCCHAKRCGSANRCESANRHKSVSAWRARMQRGGEWALRTAERAAAARRPAPSVGAGAQCRP